MSDEQNKAKPVFAIIMSSALLVVLLTYMLISAPKGVSNSVEAKEKTDYEKVGLPPPRGKDEIAKRMKEFEAEEKRLAEENIEFYQTPAGKIWRKHPEWSKEDCEKLASEDIWIGMSLDMLKYLRGKPDQANPSNYGQGVQWQYCWTGRTPSCFYDKNNDSLVDAYN